MDSSELDYDLPPDAFGVVRTITNDSAGKGYSGGGYSSVTDDRLRPGRIKLFLGWTGKGAPNDAK